MTRGGILRALAASPFAMLLAKLAPQAESSPPIRLLKVMDGTGPRGLWRLPAQGENAAPVIQEAADWAAGFGGKLVLPPGPVVITGLRMPPGVLLEIHAMSDLHV